MGKIKLSIIAAAVSATALLMPSCTDLDSKGPWMLKPSAVVTVKPQPDGQFIMQLDENTVLIPTNLKTSPFGKKEVRALVNYTESESRAATTRNVCVNWIDSIRTKNTVPSLGDLNDTKYGNDPIEIVKDWLTVAEDGYLTLRIRTIWGCLNVRHSINLLTDVNPENPYELELRHDANGDVNGELGDALIAFNLKNLPHAEGENIIIKLNWNSYTGPKSVEFDLGGMDNATSLDFAKPAFKGFID